MSEAVLLLLMMMMKLGKYGLQNPYWQKTSYVTVSTVRLKFQRFQSTCNSRAFRALAFCLIEHQYRELFVRLTVGHLPNTDLFEK
jgi:hypothetical protein